MGINIGSHTDFRHDRIFADVMKTSRRYYTVSGTTVATVDANGWPTQDCQVYAWSGLDNMHGTYKLSFTGKATVTAGGLSYSVVNQTYNATTNTTTADFIVSATAVANCGLFFKNTNYNGTLNTGVKNIKLMRPLTPGSTSSYSPATTFTDQFKAIVNKFSVIRFMGFFATNSNNISTWSQRSLPTDATAQMRRLPSTVNTSLPLADVGGCYEYAIQLCNEMNKDMWLNVPLKVDDDYVTQLATLVKNQLNPGLKVYVEYSNEVWNTGPGFTQGNENHTMAVNEVNAGGSPLNYDGQTNDWYWAWRRVGKRTVEISNIFRSVFGDAAMMTRVRPVLMSQAGNPGTVLKQSLFLIEDVYGKVTPWCSIPHPVNYYIYGAGGSGYYNPNLNQTPAITLDNYWDSGSMNLNNWSYQKTETDWVLSFGLKRICYEGGPSLDVSGTLNQTAWGDPRMTGEIIEHHDYWSQNGGDLFVYFDTCTSYNWGFTLDVLNLNTPKLNGIDYLNSHPKAALSYGFGLPATISPSSAQLTIRGVKNYVNTGDLLLDPNGNGWASYLIRVESPGNYNVSFRTIPAYSYTGSMRVSVDASNISGTLQVNSPSQVSGTVSTGYLQAGLHAIRFTNVSTVSLGLSAVYVVPAASEILHYKFDEGSGTTVNDSAGGHTTTVSGAKWTGTGKFGGAYNNASDTSSLPVRFSPANQADLNFDPQTQDFTISCWVKISPSVAVTYRSFVAKYQTSPTTVYQYLLWLPNNFSRLGAFVGNQPATFALPAPINDDQWHLVTLTNGSVGGVKKFTMYFDDGAGAKASLPVTTGTGGVVSGSCQVFPGVGSGGVGQMDDLRILNRAVSQSEVAAIYNGTFTP